MAKKSLKKRIDEALNEQDGSLKDTILSAGSREVSEQAAAIVAAWWENHARSVKGAEKVMSSEGLHIVADEVTQLMREREESGPDPEKEERLLSHVVNGHNHMDKSVPQVILPVEPLLDLIDS